MNRVIIPMVLVDGYLQGMLKKAASGVPCLRRSGYAFTRWSASTRKRAGRSPFFRAHVLHVRSARQTQM